MAQEAEEQLNQGKIGNIPEASALTHKQVLEMAVAEASRRVQEATKYGLHVLCMLCPLKPHSSTLTWLAHCMRRNPLQNSLMVTTSCLLCSHG